MRKGRNVSSHSMIFCKSYFRVNRFFFEGDEVSVHLQKKKNCSFFPPEKKQRERLSAYF